MTNLLTAKNIQYRYGNANPVLNDINFTLLKGEMVYIRGSSGGGKSTLLKLLNRLLEPCGGTLEFMGNPYTEIDAISLRKKVQMVSQIPFLLPATVRENILISAGSESSGTKLGEILEAFNLDTGLLEKSGTHLSVGQAARVCVIRSLMLKPDVLLLDEPTASLDPDNRATFVQSFEKIKTALGMAVIWITHDPSMFNSREGRHLLLSEGRLHDC